MKKKSSIIRRSEMRTYNLGDGIADVLEAQLIDIDFYPRMSEETLAFNATLMIRYSSQVYTFDCRNDGHGGCTVIQPHCIGTDSVSPGQFRDIIRRWDSYLRTQRDEKFYEAASQMGWSLSDKAAIVTKNAESEVNNMLAEWCDVHNL